MTDATNVTAPRPAVKDKTAAERSRRYRRNRRKTKVRDVPEGGRGRPGSGQVSGHATRR
jgi:hypothetical protein